MAYIKSFQLLTGKFLWECLRKFVQKELFFLVIDRMYF